MLDLIFFLLIAVVIFIKLFRIFGQTDDTQGGMMDFNQSFVNANQKNDTSADIHIVSATEAALPQKIRDIFDSIRSKENNFNADLFISGTKKAFVMIINAFTKCDKSALQFLLSDDVYKAFSREVDNRAASGYIYSKSIVGIKEIEILDATLINDFASITVKIISDQISCVKDKAGNLLSGNQERIVAAEDVWQFGKQIKNGKVWLLLATSAHDNTTHDDIIHNNTKI